jgi:hypothetical protein
VKETVDEMTESISQQDDDDDDDTSESDRVNGAASRLRGLSARDRNKGGEAEDRDSPPIWNRHPSIKYNHYGQPNCFDYDWVMVPPAKA